MIFVKLLDEMQPFAPTSNFQNLVGTIPTWLDPCMVLSPRKAFLEDMGKGGNNVSYYVKKAAKYNWPSTELFQAERTYATASHGRKRQKLGGSLPWFASKPVLTQMWRDIVKS